MRLFYQAFPIRDAVRRELSWTHYRILLGVEDATARNWYTTEACTQNRGKSLASLGESGVVFGGSAFSDNAVKDQSDNESRAIRA